MGDTEDMLKRLIEAGVELSHMTRARAEAIVRDLVRSGEIRFDQAQARVEALLDRSRRRTESVAEVVRDEVARQVDALGLTTREDLTRWTARLAESVAGVAGAVANRAATAGRQATSKGSPTAAKKAPDTAKKAPTKSAEPSAKKTPAHKAPASAKKAPAKKAPAPPPAHKAPAPAHKAPAPAKDAPVEQAPAQTAPDATAESVARDGGLVGGSGA